MTTQSVRTTRWGLALTASVIFASAPFLSYRAHGQTIGVPYGSPCPFPYLVESVGCALNMPEQPIIGRDDFGNPVLGDYDGLTAYHISQGRSQCRNKSLADCNNSNPVSGGLTCSKYKMCSRTAPISRSSRSSSHSQSSLSSFTATPTQQVPSSFYMPVPQPAAQPSFVMPNMPHPSAPSIRPLLIPSGYNQRPSVYLLQGNTSQAAPRGMFGWLADIFQSLF
jgi:hypothetical protein